MTERWRLVLLLCAMLIGIPHSALAREDRVLTLGDDLDVTVTRYPAAGDYLLVWLAPEYGFREMHRSLAQALAEQGIEVWQSNLVEAMFLPQNTASQRQLDGTLAAELIEWAGNESGKPVAVVADSYAAITALRGAHQWQGLKHAQANLVGVLLFSPYAYHTIPPLGVPPEFVPVVRATNVPIMILQSLGSATTTHHRRLLADLRKNGGPVYTYAMPGLMGLFYEEPPSPEMRKMSTEIPRLFKQVLPLLQQHGVPDNRITIAVNEPGQATGIDIYLKAYRGQVKPEPIELEDVNGNVVAIDKFSGKVTLINFWASWCPPCVEEIPSMNRLMEKMHGQPFELISINYAEDRETVRQFMRRIRVDFPVLLDLDGRYARQWNVVSYPSTFVVGPDGSIRYGVNAAIAWDAEEVISVLTSLLNARPRQSSAR